MSIVCGKALFGILSGENILASHEVVGVELQSAKEHLEKGLGLYQPWKEEDHKKWCETTKLKKEKQEFVGRLGNLLDLTSEQAWKVFQLFLQYEYRGSFSQLSGALSNDREESLLFHQVLTFYLSDQIHLLNCRRFIIENSKHPYQMVRKDFVDTVLDPDKSWGTKLVTQLKTLSGDALTNFKIPESPLLPLNAQQTWISHRLAAIKHQLSILLVYYGSPTRKCSPQSAQNLFQCAQGGGLGWALVGKFDGIDRSQFISQLEDINALHCMLLVLIIAPEEPTENHSLCEDEWIKRLDPIVKSFGSKPWQLPPLLAWIIIQGKYASKKYGDDSPEAKSYINIAKRTIKPALFEYLTSILTSSMLQTKMDYVLYKIAVFVSYSLVCLAGTCFDLDRFGLTDQVQDLSRACVSIEGTASCFWSEPSGLAAVIVPSAMECFPHRPQYLLQLCSTLAKASDESCLKAIELLKEVETLNWPLLDAHQLSISGAQVVTVEDYCLIPGIVLPRGTHGTILDSQSQEPLVCWRYPISGWQFLLATFKALENQMTSGSPTDDWLVKVVIMGLYLMSSIMKSSPSQEGALAHLSDSARCMLISGARIPKPNYELISALMEFFAECSENSPSTIWADLDGSSLLPTLHHTYLRQNYDITGGYKAGSVRVLICGIEAESGTYSILKSLIKLLESAIRFRENLNHNHVNGCIVFLMKEVLPVMLQWCYVNVTEKVSCMLQILNLLNLAVEDQALDRGMSTFIASEIIGPSSGAGRALRAVLDGASALGPILDSPSEWPTSEHTKQFSHMSRSALCLTHSLVSQYLNWDQNDNSQGTDIFGGSALKRAASAGHNSSKGPPHIALTIARHVHLRLDPKVSYLALRTLTHIAKELRVPLVACLSVEAEGLRDCLLTRLTSSTEDLMVKTGLLRLLTASCQHQPGIIRLFLTPPKPLLETIIALFKIHQKEKENSSKMVVEALVDCVASLWTGNFNIATSYLRDNKDFWDALSRCLCGNKPGSIDDIVVGNILKIFSLEYFESEDKICDGLDQLMKLFFDGSKSHFTSWFEYLLVSTVEASTNSGSPVKTLSSDKSVSKSVVELLQSTRDFFVLIMKRAKKLLSQDQKIYVGTMCLKGLQLSLESEGDDMGSIQTLLSEIHLALLQENAKDIMQKEEYRTSVSKIMSHMRANIMHTSTQCQILILTAVVRGLISCPTDKITRELSTAIVDSAMLISEQHCTVTCSASQDPSQMAFTTPGILALSCTLLHHCLISISEEQADIFVQQSHIRESLMGAAAVYTKTGNSAVVKEILRLLTFFARLFPVCQVVTPANLATSVSLALLSQSEEVTVDILPDLLWCTTCCLERRGASDLDDVISIASLHMPLIKKCLEKPHLYPKIALAAVSLCQVLVPHQSLWRVFHPQCFEQLLTSTACCVQRTTSLLRLKETLQREVFGDKISSSNEEKTNSMESLMSQLLKVLATCLRTLQFISPNLVDLLCCPGMDLTTWSSSLIQPTCRRINSDLLNTLPNLATLADILYLYKVVLPKDTKTSPMKLPSQCGTSLDLGALNACAESALILLMSHSALLLISPDVHRRDAREVRTFLADETDSFFSHILGKRTVSSSPPINASPSVPNAVFLKLCSELVTSICQTKIS